MVSAANPMERYETTIRKLEQLNQQVFNAKLLYPIDDIHAAKKFSEERRKILKKGIFKLEKPEKHRLFLSLDYYRLFEQTIEKNVVLRDMA